MRKLSRQNQEEKQKKYFGKEFSSKSSYTLKPWQVTQLSRIKKSLNLENYQNKTVLDLGTGSGYVAVELAKLGLKVIAVDLTPEAIENLEKYKKEYGLTTLELFISSAEKLPLKDNSVDYIVSNAILEHINEEDQAITEWKRVLRPGGKMFITVPLKFRYIWPFLWPLNYFHDKRIGHLRRYDQQSLSQKFGQIPLKVYYSGHLVKVFGVLLTLIFSIGEKFENYLEMMDQRSEQNPYGANNISVVFQIGKRIS